MADAGSWFDAMPDAQAPAAPEAVPSGSDLIARAQSIGGGQYVPSGSEAEQMSQDLAAVAQRRRGRTKGDWFDAMPDVQQPAPAQQQQPTDTRPSLSGMAGNLAAGGNEALAAGFGSPVDAATWLLNKGLGGLNIPPIEHPIGGSASIRQAMGLVGANPENFPARAPAEQVMRATGRGIGSILPMMAGGAGLAAAAPGTVAGNVGRQLATMPLGGSVIAGASGGATGEVAKQNVSEPYKPLAEFGGNIIGGMAPTLMGAAAGRALGPAAQTARNFLATMMPGGRQRLAGEQIIGAASDPSQFRAGLANAQELVPGSQPTTFQATGDQGVGQLERAARTRNAEPFAQRAVEQNAARNQAVEALQPQGNAGAVGSLFRQQLADLEARGQAATNQARAEVAGATAALGGEESSTAYGAAAREKLAANNAAAKAQESALWNSIDPTGKAGIDATPFQEGVDAITSGRAASAKDISGEEAAILDTVKVWPRIQSLAEVRAMRSRISDAIRAEIRAGGTTESAVVRRLMGYKDALDGALESALDRQDFAEQQAVAKGTLSFQDTLQAQRSQWLAERDARTAAQTGTGRRGGSGPGNGPGVGSVASSGAPRTAQSADRTPSQPPGTQGVPSETRPLTPDELSRYKTARQATVERKDTYRQGPVGKVLAPGENAGFRVSEANVGSKLWRAGPEGAEAIKAYVKAGGDPAILQGHAVASLREAGIIQPDGTVDAARFGRWQTRYQSAIDELPGGLANKFATAQKAQQTLDDTMAAHAQAVRDFEHGAARNFLNDDPAVAVRKAFAAGNPGEEFGKLAQMVKGNPDAEAGLRRAVVDHIQNEIRNASTDFYKPEIFQRFVRRNITPLKVLFGGQGANNLEMVAADLRRTQQQVLTKAGTAGSDTAQNLALAAKHGGAKHSVLSWLMTVGGPILGEHVVEAVGGHPVAGIALGAIPAMASALRQRGIAKLNELVDEAMLNPDLARELVSKVSGPPSLTLQKRLASRLVATLPGMAANAAQQ